MNGYTKIDAELVLDSREVLEARPRSTPPPRPSQEEERRNENENEEEDRWENAPCTD